MCALGQDEPRQNARALLAQPVAWRNAVDAAIEHGVAPAFYRNLLALGAPIPAAEREILDRRCQGTAQRNLFLATELQRILAACEAASVEAVPFKGPALEIWYWGGVGARAYDDLDILVRPEQVRHARAVLENLGYRMHTAMDAAEFDRWLREKQDIQLEREDGRAGVELHWRLNVQNEPFDLAWIWPRAGRRTLLSKEVRAIAPGHLLLIVAVHGAKHYWTTLKWVRDAVEVARRCDAGDWTMAIEQARATGSRRILFVALELGRELLGAPIPADAEAALADGVGRAMAAQLAARILGGETRAYPFFEHFRFHVQIRERGRDRVRLLLQTFQFFQLRGPADRSFRGWLRRPFRLVQDYGGPLVRLAKSALGGRG